MICAIRVLTDLKKVESSNLLGEGLRELVQLIIRGKCLTEDDSIAYDRSFA